MRIISGELKRRNIKTADLEFLRPATDRYRETLFNILNNYLYFEDTNILDLYAGSGAMGFECISRGAKQATFIEKQNKTFHLIKENAKIFKIEDKCNIINSTAEYFVKTTNEKFDLIFADPPYIDETVYEVFRIILSKNLLAENGIMILQRGRKTLIKDEKEFNLKVYKKIGGDVIFLYQNKKSENI